ncbi:MAG: GspE/PulE family protein [Candidatus Kuenenbacteria bacterium]
MQLFKDNLINLLLQEKLIDEKQALKLEKEKQEIGQTIEEIIKEEKIISEKDLIKTKSKLLNIPIVDLLEKKIKRDCFKIISEDLSKNYKMIIFEKNDKKIKIAMINPDDFKAQEVIEFIARENNLKVEYYITDSKSLEFCLNQYSNLITEIKEALETAEDLKVIKDEKKLSEDETYQGAPISKVVSVIFKHAVEGLASDIHIEPTADETRIRYRLDGILHTSLVLPKNVHSAVISRIKVMANLKLDETRIPQDGRIRLKMGEQFIDFRISILPLMDNEKAVIRVLNTSNKIFTLDMLGFFKDKIKIIEDNIKKPHGILLVTGPTGCGKSTTLFALLCMLNNEKINISTLEDPIEYFIKGVNQSQIRPALGFSFASGLRTLLRQDPDIIMVGEIRDDETTELVIHAGLTGHFVLSTLHTNDAFGAIPRLIDMKGKPFLLANVLNVIIAQRLVRRLCENCKEQISLSSEEEDKILFDLKNLSKEVIPIRVSLNKPLKVYKAKGCVYCKNTGYQGRIAISEVLNITNKMREKIIQAEKEMLNFDEELKKQNFVTIKQDGLLKVLLGFTSLEEVWAVTED